MIPSCCQNSENKSSEMKSLAIKWEAFIYKGTPGLETDVQWTVLVFVYLPSKVGNIEEFAKQALRVNTYLYQR